MSRLIEFPLNAKGQAVVLVESNDPAPEGPRQVSVAGTMAEKANKAFDEAIAGIKPIAECLSGNILNHRNHL